MNIEIKDYDLTEDGGEQSLILTGREARWVWWLALKLGAAHTVMFRRQQPHSHGGSEHMEGNGK